MSIPIAKLTDENTNGYGLAIEAGIKYRRTRPADDNFHKHRSENDSGYLMHEVFAFITLQRAAFTRL